MALSSQTLANTLESGWLALQPSSVEASAASFADVVSRWFAGATANAVPCATALARAPLLAIAVKPALDPGTVEASSSMLGAAVVSYIVGQTFGLGVAGAPVAIPAALADLYRAFVTLEMQRPARAELIAGAIVRLTSSTLVVFPSPAPPAAIV